MGRLAILVAALVIAASPALAKSSTKPDKGTETGIASIYSTDFVGHRTASGERFDKHRLTAAHRRLPFGTKVEVINRRNGRKVVVTVNDRGPHRKGRIIDLSPAAAAQLGMLQSGLAPVDIRIATMR